MFSVNLFLRVWFLFCFGIPLFVGSSFASTHALRTPRERLPTGVPKEELTPEGSFSARSIGVRSLRALTEL